MRSGLVALMMALGLALLLTTGVSAAMLLCISNKNLKGEETVASCVAKGDRFAVVDRRPGPDLDT